LIKFIGIVFIVFSFFPYVSPIPNNFDSQPFSMIFGTIFLILVIIKKGGVAKKFAPLGLLFCIFVILFIFDILIFEDYSLVARTVANYLSLCFLPVAFYYYLERYGFPKKILKFSIIVYALIALIQTFWSKYIFEFLVDVRTTDGRGVTSLTPEPTYYGLICYLFLLVVIVSESFTKKEKIIYSIVLTFQILLLAKSSMIVLFLILMFGALLLTSGLLNIRNILGASLLCLLSFSCVVNYGLLEGSRIFKLIELASVDGFFVFGKDASMNERLSNIYISFYGFFANLGFPGLFSTFSSFSERKEEISNGFFWYGGTGNKIMSYWGTIVYEMGVFVVLYFIIIIRSIYHKKTFMLFAFITPLLAAVPLANPLVSLIIALCLLNRRKV
jgi:hypothetical protein